MILSSSFNINPKLKEPRVPTTLFGTFAMKLLIVVNHGRWKEKKRKEHDLRFDVPELVGHSSNREVRN